MRFVVDTDELRAQHGVERQRAGELRAIQDEIRSSRSVPLNMSDPRVRNGVPEWHRSNVERWLDEVEQAIERAAVEYRTVANQVDGMQNGAWWGAGAGVHGLAALRGTGLGSVWSGSAGSGSLLGLTVPPGAVAALLTALGGGLLGGVLRQAGVGRGATGSNPFGRLVADARAQAGAARRMGDQLRSVLASGATTLSRATGAALHFAQSGLGRLRTWATSAWNAIWSRADALVRQVREGLAQVVKVVVRVTGSTAHTVARVGVSVAAVASTGFGRLAGALRQEVVVSGDPGGRAGLWHLQGNNEYKWGSDCSLASSAEVLTDLGLPMTEDQVVKFAAAHKLATIDKKNPFLSGGVKDAATIAANLTRLGMPSAALKGQSMDQLARAVEGGHGVIIAVDCGVLWNDKSHLSANGGVNHAIMVTGVRRDSKGVILGFYVNDTGIPHGANVFHDVKTMRNGWEHLSGPNASGNVVVTSATRPLPSVRHEAHGPLGFDD